jgi:hypothetical protein
MITVNNTIPGFIKDIEVKGNTYQDPNNLSKIVSAGIPSGDGTYKMSILSCGENLWDIGSMEHGKTYYMKLPMGQFTFSLVASSVTSARVGIFVVNEDNSALSSKVIANNVLTNITFTNSKVQNVGFKIGGWDSGATLQSTKDIKLQEGTVATPYTPYEETRCDIKLPCQLEKWDRLYFDKVENAWVVDKRTKNYVFNKSSAFTGHDLSKPNTLRIRVDDCKDIFNSNGECFSNVFSNNTDFYGGDTEGVQTLNGSYFIFRINKNSIGYIDGESSSSYYSKILNYLTPKGAFIKYPSTNSEKIVLPQSEQIKLNSFANKTHIYTISGDVDATVKATVSKSLASTVQANTDEINILNGKIEDIQGLKESQDFAYELPNGQNYLVCKDTQNGTVKDLKIYGKSVVNVAPKSIAPIKLSIDKRVNDTTLISPILANTEFTVGVNVTAKKAPLKGLLISFRFADGTFAYDVLTTGVYSQFKTFKFSKDVMAISEYLHLDELTADATANITFDSLIVCEGVINTYFEGIASVGNGNEVEVLSSDNGNLFDGEFIKGTVNGVDGNLIPDTNGYMITQKNIIKVFPGISVKYKSTGARGFRPGKNVSYYYYDKSEKIISRGSLNTFDEISIPNGCYGLRLTFADFELNSSFNASNYNMTLNQIGTLENSNFAKQDKKQFYLKIQIIHGNLY